MVVQVLWDVLAVISSQINIVGIALFLGPDDLLLELCGGMFNGKSRSGFDQRINFLPRLCASFFQVRLQFEKETA
jgi:hypothetical protein